jgi:hypothetical protein
MKEAKVMNDQHDRASGKTPWRSPKIIDVGLVDEQTTAGVGNVGDQATGKDKWKPLTIEDAKVTLPDGE